MDTKLTHKVVSHTEWIKARQQLLIKEKEFTKLRDQISQQQRNFPWEAVTQNYTFAGEQGEQTLLELFDGRSQLIIYHFMFAPDWEAGCSHCSFWADNFNNIIPHLNQRDVTMLAVSRALYVKLAAYKKRMGWNFQWVSSHDTKFNFDFQASFTDDELAAGKAFYNFTTQNPNCSEREGVSVFYRDESEQIFHTYSTYARGIDILNTTYNYLDLVPKGRDESGSGSSWIRRHDEY